MFIRAHPGNRTPVSTVGGYYDTTTLDALDVGRCWQDIFVQIRRTSNDRLTWAPSRSEPKPLAVCKYALNTRRRFRIYSHKNQNSNVIVHH